MRNLIIYDYEVFKYDTLLGAIIINDDVTVYQTWDLTEQLQFYLDNKESIWLGHNNSGYDNFILEAVVKGWSSEQIKALSDKIITTRKKYLSIPLNYYDLMEGFTSLKLLECAMGKNISTSEVDFAIDRPLTDEEKRKTESYNRDDLFQTLDDFDCLKGAFLLRLDVIKEFGLSLDNLHVTGTQLAENVLHAEYTDGIESWRVPPTLYPQLQVKNKDVLDFYLNEDFKSGKKLSVELCGVKHQLGSGGIHAARSKYHADWAYYFDVSGYYNLVMINYDLLPRSIPEEYRQFYKDMYKKQLEMKVTAPEKRWTYKVILLSVFGAMTNEWCKFYDPYRGQLVTITGQIFLVDLLEKLEGKVELVQSNTDGIIAKPLPGVSDEELLSIIDEWQQRTGFELHLDKITDIHQRDVNCYMYKNKKGEICTLGDVKHYMASDDIFYYKSYNAKEPWIIAKCIVEYFMGRKLPEQTIAETADDLQMFQCICKKGTFDGLEYEYTDIDGQRSTIILPSISRAFALRTDYGTGILSKTRKEGKITKTKIAGMPDSVFIYNEDIHDNTAKAEIQSKIDWQYYVNRAYERIQEFLDIKLLKDVKL